MDTLGTYPNKYEIEIIQYLDYSIRVKIKVVPQTPRLYQQHILHITACFIGPRRRKNIYSSSIYQFLIAIYFIATFIM